LGNTKTCAFAMFWGIFISWVCISYCCMVRLSLLINQFVKFDVLQSFDLY
jgi:hypothetical protein